MIINIRKRNKYKIMSGEYPLYIPIYPEITVPLEICDFDANKFIDDNHIMSHLESCKKCSALVENAQKEE